MGDREELDALRRLAELEAKSGAPSRDLNVLQRRMGVGHRSGPPTADVPLEGAGYELGGTATDLAAKVLPPAGAAAVGTAVNLAPDIATTLMGGGAGAAMKAPEAAKAVMQSALKPIQSQVASGKFDRAVDTMLKEGIPATKAGVAKMRDMINTLEQEVSGYISNASGQISKDAILQRLKPVFDKYRAQALPEADTAAVTKAEQEFGRHPMLNSGGRLSLQDAQSVKEGTYRAIGDKGYGAGLKPQAERDAQKALARGLKEEIEAIVPEVSAPNARQSELINAMKLTSRRTGVEANKNMAGLGWLVHGGPTSPWYWAWLAERSPAAKSALAQGLYTGNLGRNLGAVAGAGGGYELSSPVQRPITLQDILEAQRQ